MVRMMSENELRNKLKGDEKYRQEYISANYFGILKGYQLSIVEDCVRNKERNENYKNEHYSVVNNIFISAMLSGLVALIFSAMNGSDLVGAGLFIVWLISFFIVTIYTKSKMLGHEDVISSDRLAKGSADFLVEFNKEFDKEIMSVEYQNSRAIEDLYGGFLRDAMDHVRQKGVF